MSALDQLTPILDPVFGNGGVSSLRFAGISKDLYVFGLTAAADGRIYYTGRFDYREDDVKYMLGRLNADGSPDYTFADGGLIVDSFGHWSDGKAIYLLDNGKVLLVGKKESNTTLARYEHNGVLDLTFGTRGKVMLDATDAVSVTSQDPESTRMEQGALATTPVQLLPDGKILVGVAQDQSSSYINRLYRLQSDGSPDLSFNDLGYIDVRPPDTPGNDNSVLKNVLVQADGKYLVCGQTLVSRAFVARYNTDGQLDRTFGGTGFVVVRPTDHLHMFNELMLQPNGRILCSGYRDPGETGLLASFEPDGSFNIQFNAGQPLYIRVEQSTIFSRSVMQADGKFLVSGVAPKGSASLFRFESSGRLDLSFNGTGWARTGFSTRRWEIAMTAQGDGKILIAGYDNDNQCSVISRYLP
ncbi:hypothetical protein OH720_25865 [Pseudomonas sp. WJP1]|uniref:hypothetical protein n=1 Tax=Pseudomonas sp. WJP1 TaxID=2986947 RepID=UPI002349F328|nr:hypothetical protein [Pseudomonas sp. WJP1]WCM50350.1 hypothetical protein OH720_25865 [Pseudomonas sp. WJP1]